jgi:hypothetical protein
VVVAAVSVRQVTAKPVCGTQDVARLDDPHRTAARTAKSTRTERYFRVRGGDLNGQSVRFILAATPALPSANSG